MMNFWIFAALLVFVAVACVLWPLLRKNKAEVVDVSEKKQNIDSFRDQLIELDAQLQAGLVSEQNHHRLKTELEKKLVDEVGQTEKLTVRSDRKTPAFAWVLAILIPVLALPMYWKLGAQTELQVREALFSGSSTPEYLGNLLEEWVDKKPGNDKAMFLLGSHYLENGQMDKAVSTYRQLFRMSNGHPQVAAELAQALFLQNNNAITDEVRKLYQRTLLSEENNTTALGLKGIDAYASANYPGAVAAWQQAMTYEPNPNARQSLIEGINKAREMMGDTTSASQIKIFIDRAPELASLPGNARIVVFARPSGTRQPPVVAIPLTVGELPKELVLDDNSAMMMGGNPLSSYETLDIIGRISLSGDVMKADYQVQVSDVKTSDSEPVKLIFTPAS